MLKIVHTADYHWESEKLDKCQASADFIISKLREIQPDLHVIAGDYWNRRQMLTNASAFRPAIDVLTAMANICPTVIIKGNNEHDAEGSIEWLSDLETGHPVYAVERPATIIWCRDDGKFYTLSPSAIFADIPREASVVLHLFPYPTKAHFLADKPGLSIDESNLLIQDEIQKIMLGFGAISANAKCPVILVAHCNVNGAVLSTGQTLLGQDIMISKHDLALADADYVALGHIHKAQCIGPKMWYAGSIYHNNFGETERKQFNLLEMGERGSGHTFVDEIEIPSRPLSLHEIETGEVIDMRVDSPNPGSVLPGLSGMFDPEIQSQDWRDTELRIRVHGTKERLALITDEQIKSNYPGAFSYQVERIITPDERIRSSEIVKAKSLREKMTEWGKSIDREIDPEILELADEAERSCVI